LEKFEDLIPPIIRQHYEDIVVGGTRYQGYRHAVSNITNARWDWQVDVPCTTGRNNRGRLPIRCRGGFFEDEVVEMGEPCLWIVDCRRGGTGDNDAPWTNVEYRKVFQQIWKWMAGIHRWTAILLFPTGLFFDQDMHEMFALSAECTWRQGVWIFQPHVVPSYTQDMRYNGRTVQAIGGVALVMEHPVGSKVAPNIRRGREQLPLAFTNVWNEDRMPRAVDRLERSPTELQRMV
jgi:hypothetical protein